MKTRICELLRLIIVKNIGVKNSNFLLAIFRTLLVILLVPLMAKNSIESKVKTNVPQNYGTFCIECGTDLDRYCFTVKAENKKAISRNHDKCVETGKFSGEFCSKMFIASDSLLDEIWEDMDSF